VDLPEIGNHVFFVHLSGDRLYTEADYTLYVYSMSDLTSPIATYPLGGRCYSGIIIDDRLYLGVYSNLHEFKVTAFLTQPLTRVTQITTKELVKKILRVGNELLLLGEGSGYLQVVDMNTSKITHTHRFRQGGNIYDIIAIDDTHYLLAAERGLLKTTKDQLMKHYYKGKDV
jgi:hypothetical protein